MSYHMHKDINCSVLIFQLGNFKNHHHFNALLFSFQNNKDEQNAHNSVRIP